MRIENLENRVPWFALLAAAGVATTLLAAVGMATESIQPPRNNPLTDVLAAQVGSPARRLSDDATMRTIPEDNGINGVAQSAPALRNARVDNVVTQLGSLPPTLPVCLATISVPPARIGNAALWGSLSGAPACRLAPC